VLASYPAAVAAVLRETGNAIGIDIDRLLAPATEHAALPPARSASSAAVAAQPLPPAAPETERYQRSTRQGMTSVSEDEGGAL
jgi:hypothetical protein